MFKCVGKNVWHSIRSNKRRTFVFYTLTVMFMFKMSQHMSGTDIMTSRYDVTAAEFDVILREIDQSGARQVDIIRHVTRYGIIDKHRTPVLIQSTQQKLNNHFWLNSQCALAQPISQGILNRGMTAKSSEYMTEAHRERVVVSLAHREHAREAAMLDGISLLTQMSVDRLDLLQMLARKWKGPINAAVYTPFAELGLWYGKVGAWLQESGRKNIIVHLAERTHRLYPVNWLRNLVISNASTEYILMVDADFIPSANLMDELKKGFRKLKENKQEEKHALIVPAFEIFDSDVENLPESKKKLLELERKGTVDVFHRKWHPDGHRIWNFDRWKHSKHGFVLPKEKVCSEPEPYIAVKKSQSPYFPETLLERGKNKVAYHFEMCVRDYHFTVIPYGHLIHMPHPESAKANLNVDWCVSDAWRVYRTHTAHAMNKGREYRHLLPAFVRNTAYIMLCLLLECLWLLWLESPLVIFFIVRKIFVWRTALHEHRMHQV